MREPIDAIKLSLKRYPQLYKVLGAVKRHLMRPQPSSSEVARLESVRRIQTIEEQVQACEAKGRRESDRPVIFFNPSAHTYKFGLNAAVALLSSWALRLAGYPVIYYVCKRGISQCVLGSNRQGVFSPPPCDSCISLSDSIYPLKHIVRLGTASQNHSSLRAELQMLSWSELTSYSRLGLDLGRLCMPSLRWVERCFNLEPNEFRRQMLVEYIVSATRLADEFGEMLDRWQPRAVVLFNGTHYPEATARKVAVNRGVRVITHETGLRGISAFFSHGVATEYDVRVPLDFKMSPAENYKLDAYLSQRSEGNFTYAGRRIWSEMKGVPHQLIEKVKAQRQAVVVFTNVAWDTSQVYSNVFFNDMFDWLDCIMRQAVKRSDTLFIVRVHPDESRPAKPSKETVADWLHVGGYLELPNLIFIPPDAHISSYELIALAKFCVVYSSTVGLEAAVMGKLVLPGGWTRYRQAGACYEVTSREDFSQKLHELLDPERPAAVPPEWQSNARRFFYFSLFRASLDFSSLVEPVGYPEFTLKHVDVDALRPDRTSEMQVIVDGILHGTDFYYR